jgi:hypothetical protein
MMDKEINLTLEAYDVLGSGMEKIASSGNLESPAITELPEEYDPDFLYLRVRAISAGEYWGCFPGGQMVLMGAGAWKDIKDVKVGDYVYTPHGNTRKVLVKSEKDYKGYLEKLYISKANTTVACTSLHPVLAIPKNEVSCLHDKHDKHVKCLPQYVGERSICSRKYSECTFEVPFKEVWTCAKDINIGDYVGYKGYVPRCFLNLTNEEMYFVGLYLAKGSLIYPKKGRKHLLFSFGYHEKDTLVKLFLNTVVSMGVETIRGPYLSRSKGTCSVAVYDSNWFKFLEQFGRYSYGKFIIPTLKSAPNVNYLLQGFIDGDGHIDKTGRVALTTVSKQLGCDLFDVSINLGYLPSYVVYKERGEFYKDNHKDRHQITFSTRNKEVCAKGIKKVMTRLKQDKSHAFIYKDNFFIKVTNREKFLFEGKVYNLEVEEDNCYVVNGISTHNCNKNSDYFSEKELRECYHTFLDAHIFKNHANKDVANAIGSILKSEWNNEMKYVELLIKIDRQLAPTIVRGLEKGYTTDVSMGCRIKHSVCSICGNIAKTRADFCEHVRKMRNQVLPDGRRVFEYNIGPRFHDLSIVLNGADRTAKVVELVKENTVRQKIANNVDIDSYLEKCASVGKEEVPAANVEPRGMRKLADIQKEIVDKLYILAVVDKLNKEQLSDEEIEVLIQDAKEASIPLHLELGKTASTAKHLRNISLGTLGIAAATNHYQGKRLRGEELNPVQNFIADNPGVLPLAFLAFGYPGYVGLKKKLVGAAQNTKSLVTKSAGDSYTSLFKKASIDSDLTVNSAINVFESPEVAEIFKKAYHDKDSSRLKMTRLALLLEQGGNEKLAHNVKEKYQITDKDIENFMKISSDIIRRHLDKEANYIRGVVEANILTGSHKIPTGFAAPALAGSLVDGFLIHKFFYDEKPGEMVAKKVGVDIPLNNN